MSDIDRAYDPQAQASLYAKLAKVMGELVRLEKTGTNAHFNYKFVADGDVADAIRNRLADNGVAFFASMVDYKQVAPEGSKQLKTICTFQFTFADGETGATHSCLWTGEALDNQDKGFNKAATAAEKYFLLKTFMLSTGDAADDTDASASEKGSRPRTNTKPPASAQNGPSTPPQASNGTTVTTVLNTPATRVRDWDAIYRATEKHFGEPKEEGRRAHFKNLFNELERGKVITPDMPDALVIAAIHRNREEEGKSDKGWWLDKKNLRDLEASLYQTHVMNVEQATALVGGLNKFATMKAFIDAVAARDRQPANAF